MKSYITFLSCQKSRNFRQTISIGAWCHISADFEVNNAKAYSKEHKKEKEEIVEELVRIVRAAQTEIELKKLLLGVRPLTRVALNKGTQHRRQAHQSLVTDLLFPLHILTRIFKLPAHSDSVKCVTLTGRHTTALLSVPLEVMG